MDLKKVFLLDAFGAFLTTVLLLGLLVPFDHYFGMPREVLLFLAAIAFGLFVYSSTCYKFSKVITKSFLAVIIFLNIIYSMISIGVIVSYFDSLTKLGLAYFILEIIVIALLVILEINVYKCNKEIHE